MCYAPLLYMWFRTSRKGAKKTVNVSLTEQDRRVIRLSPSSLISHSLCRLTRLYPVDFELGNGLGLFANEKMRRQRRSSDYFGIGNCVCIISFSAL